MSDISPLELSGAELRTWLAAMDLDDGIRRIVQVGRAVVHPALTELRPFGLELSDSMDCAQERGSAKWEHFVRGVVAYRTLNVDCAGTANETARVNYADDTVTFIGSGDDRKPPIQVPTLGRWDINTAAIQSLPKGQLAQLNNMAGLIMANPKNHDVFAGLV